MIQEENKYLVIRIRHKLDSQEKLDLAINRMEALGVTIIDYWDIKKIQEFNVHYANKPQNANSHYFLTAKTIEVDDSLSITDDDFQMLADDCLMWFGDDCLLKFQKEIPMPSPPICSMMYSIRENQLANVVWLLTIRKESLLIM